MDGFNCFPGSASFNRVQKTDHLLITNKQSRILVTADAYDALVTDRPYSKGLKTNEALDLLYRDSGSHFDPQPFNTYNKGNKEKLEFLNINATQYEQC